MLFVNVSKIFQRFVDVGRQYRDSQINAFRHRLGDIFRIPGFRRHHRRHIFDRKIGFHIGRLVSDDTVGGRVGFIEAIRGKRFDQAPKF